MIRVACKSIFRAFGLFGKACFAKPACSGVKIAGPNNLKNTNPPTAVDFASGKRSLTDVLIKESSSRNALLKGINIYQVTES